MSWWPFENKKTVKTDFVKAFLEKASKPIPSIRSLDQLNFVVLDTETTGLNPEEDFILSFGAVKIEKGKILVHTACEWYPTSPKSGGETAKIHGLVSREEEIELEVFVKKLLPYLDQSILVGHHLGFDLQMLKKACKPFGLEKFPNPVLDTMNFAVRLEYGPQIDWHRIKKEEYSLDSLCERYGIAKDDRHTAAGDAFLTAQLLLKLLKVAESKGIENFGQLMR
ncbi:3'-5' exonuclease [Algoriphagus sp. CAU 1675]|uniref:3'-5' exonuclease n=1 Tax=Algoriphagus sp. CAU 1675 TaxID=3032597 RepID=UPI0023D99BD0|nr:3'-5' exonuclease [Algoriphagus sp. CAU 1675]MDF2156291.1 3'-5' exonuclease [Algoriphagus sp. CAU 1675]